MSAAEALASAQAADIRLRLDGNDLVLEAAVPAPPDVLDVLRRYKADIVVLLRTNAVGWSAPDWQALFEERAAIAEFDGGLPRPQAEARAFDWLLVEWLNRHPVPSAPDRCLGCGGGDHAFDPLLPFAADGSGHASLHDHCWQAWYRQRKVTAVVALAAMGIPLPPDLPDDFGENQGA